MTMTEEELEEKVKQIVEELTVKPSKTHLWKLTKEAAENKQKSAKQIGVHLTIIVFSFVLGLPVLSDICTLVKHWCKKCQVKLRRRRRRRRRRVQAIEASQQRSVANIQLENPRWMEFDYRSSVVPRGAKSAILISEQ